MLRTVRDDGKLGLRILQESPLDREGAPEPEPEPEIDHWVPSRFNVRATTEDKRLILWNTLSTSMSVFEQAQAPHVLALLKKAGFASRKQGLAGYLVDRGFLVRRGTNEYRKFQLAFGQQHYRTDRLELILLSSEDCNFRCKYCYEAFARGTMRPEVRQGIKRLVERRIEHLRAFHVSWFGGEPLYGWAAVEDLGPFFSEVTRKHGIAYSSHMTTNGYLLTPDVVDKLFAWQIKGFQITLDGAPEHHDCNRPTRDGRGTFWTIFENLKAMARRPEEFSVTLRVNFDRTNHEGVDRLFELMERELRGDPRFHTHFHAVGRWGGPNDPALEVCGAGEMEQVMAEMKAAAHRRGIPVETLRDVNRVGGQVCYAARPYNLIVGATGKLMKCTVVLDTDDHNVVGQLTEAGELVLDHDRMALWTEPAFERDTQCQKCVALPSCQGISCPLPRIQEDQRPCVPTRTRAKAELRQTLEYRPRGARRRSIALQGDSPAST